MRKLPLSLLAFLLIFTLSGAGRAMADEGPPAEPPAPREIYVSEAPSACPVCGKSTVAPIMYGKPNFTAELERAVQEGKIVLGGCVITEHDPQWECTSCGTLFYKMQNPTP